MSLFGLDWFEKQMIAKFLILSGGKLIGDFHPFIKTHGWSPIDLKYVRFLWLLVWVSNKSALGCWVHWVITDQEWIARCNCIGTIAAWFVFFLLNEQEQKKDVNTKCKEKCVKKIYKRAKRAVPQNNCNKVKTCKLQMNRWICRWVRTAFVFNWNTRCRDPK